MQSLSEVLRWQDCPSHTGQLVDQKKRQSYVLPGMFPISLLLLRNIPVLPVFAAEDAHTADRVAVSQMRSAAVLTTTASRRVQSDAGTTRGSYTHGQQSFSCLLPPSTAGRAPPSLLLAAGQKEQPGKVQDSLVTEQTSFPSGLCP